MNGIFIPQLIKKAELENYLPHRGKMLLLSRITSHNTANKTLTAECDIADSLIFFDRSIKGVSSAVSFEFMAQAVSALASILKKERGDLESICPGMILSISGFKAEVPYFAEGSTVTIHIAEDYQEGSLYRYKCTAYNAKEQPVVKALLTVMETKDMATFFKEEAKE